MNRYVSGAIALALSAVLGPMVEADTSASLRMAQNLPGNTNNNPYSSPINRANPNSMQGTRPSAPAIRGPNTCLLYTSPSPRDRQKSRMPSSA